VTTIVVPYHQDERLPEGGIPLRSNDIVVLDPDLPDGDLWERLAALYGRVAEAVAVAVAESGATPVVVSGDCLVALGVVAGVRRAGVDPAIVWFDAYGDVHTLDTSTSGYLGGLARRLVLHIDVDVIDGGELPGLLFPVSGGRSTTAVFAAVRRVLDTGRVIVVHIACPWHAGYASQNETRASLLASITS
jgi:arginase